MIKDDIVHRVRYEVYDVYGNLSTLSFGLQRSDAPAMQEKKSDIMLNPNTENLVEKEQFQLFFPPGSVYHITPFTFSVSPEPQGAWSSLIRVHDEWTPVQKYFTVKIKSRVPERYKDKCVIAAYSNGRPGSNQNAIWQNGWVSADFRSFGSYAVMVDTVPPVITPINVANGKNMARNTEIAFKVQDNLSGTDNTELIIDGEWIPTEFNRRTDKYYAYFKDMGLAAGSHSVLFRAIDDRGNVSEWKGTIVR